MAQRITLTLSFDIETYPATSLTFGGAGLFRDGGWVQTPPDVPATPEQLAAHNAKRADETRRGVLAFVIAAVADEYDIFESDIVGDVRHS